MQTRHRIPNVFNLSMVDVLCCALGCIILLWLVKSRDAGTAQAELAQVKKTKAELAQSLKDLEINLRGVKSELALKSREKDLTVEEIKRLKKASSLAATRLAKLNDDHLLLLKELAALRTESSTAKKDLKRKDLEKDDLEKALAALKDLSAADRENLRKRQGEVKDLVKTLAALKRQKADIEDLLRSTREMADKLQGKADRVPGMLAQARKLRRQLDEAEARRLALEQELGKQKNAMTRARANISELQQDKRVLAGQVARVRAEVENRFAGITLTGKRVIFLVDMSGSMELLDEKTPAPEKWLGVRNTVTKIMGSLPDLEKFQVIVFSNQLRYLLGSPGRWLDFDPKTSTDQVGRALAVVKPVGGTNMFIGFQEVFRFRDTGLDTIYVMSDGIPNMGEGLTAEQARRLRPNEQEEILGKFIRTKLRNDWNRARGGKRVRINTVGFFFESPDVGAFLWALARENDGSFVGMSQP